MSYDFDVFISYAREDGKDFAADLTEMLRAAGLVVWLDRERMPPGVTVNDELVEGLRKCQSIVYLISPRWLARDYPQWEHDVFVEQDRRRRQVPVSLVADLRKEPLGPGLSRLNWVTWLPESDTHAVFWQIYCGLLKLDLGPELEWTVQGRRQLGKPAQLEARNLLARPEPTGTLTAVTFNEEVVALTCDRHPQWGELTASVAAAGNQAIFVVGPERQAHHKFLNRIEKCLPKDPPRRVVAIVWDPPRVPVGRGPFIDALCRAFACSESQLVARMRTRLADQSLVLVHQPVAQQAFDRDDLVRYYTEWLPEVVEAAAPRPPSGHGSVKAVQAVEWLSVSWWAELWSWLRAQRADLYATSSSRAARRLLESLRRQEDPRLPVSFLAELSQISVADVEAWSRQHTSDRDRMLLERVRAENPDSAAILEQIEVLYGPYRRHIR